jgi:hypothetical protein
VDILSALGTFSALAGKKRHGMEVEACTGFKMVAIFIESLLFKSLKEIHVSESFTAN